MDSSAVECKSRVLIYSHQWSRILYQEIHNVNFVYAYLRQGHRGYVIKNDVKVNVTRGFTIYVSLQCSQRRLT